MAEYFEIVDESDCVIGRALRSECHGNPALVHRSAHVLVFNGKEELLLQLRSMLKDIQPGRWDTSVGGHLDPGEGYLQAARREMEEELGLKGLPLLPLYKSRIRNEIESENIFTYLTLAESYGDYSQREISELRWWSAAEIEAEVGCGRFTPNFEEEWQAWKVWRKKNPGSLEALLRQAGD